MTTSKTIPAQDVTPGMTVRAHGYSWLVLENHFDPKGNTGNQPRRVLVCKAADDKVPGGYREHMSLGFCVDAPVTLAN